MASSTKLIFVNLDNYFYILNAPPSDHVGVVVYMNWPSQFSTMGVITKIQEYSQDIECALIASKLPHNIYQVEFTKNDDGTLKATGRYVGADVPLCSKKIHDNIAAHHAQWVLNYYSKSLEEKCAKIQIPSLMLPARRGGFFFRLTEKVENEMCVICQQEYEVNDEIHLLDCNHNYHITCLERWLVKKKKDSCPMCRTTVSSDHMSMYVWKRSVKKSKRRENKESMRKKPKIEEENFENP